MRSTIAPRAALMMLTLLTACSDEHVDTLVRCTSDAECLNGQICTEDNRCVRPLNTSDMGADMLADLGAPDLSAPADMSADEDMDAPDLSEPEDMGADADMDAPDLALDMDAPDLEPDLPSNNAPTVSMVAITPDPIPAAGAPLSCVYTFADADGDPDQSTVAWLVDGAVKGSGQGFTLYGVGQSIQCQVTPHDGIGAGAPVTSAALIASGLTDVSASDGYTCAVYGGAAKCWGSNEYDQLGDGSGQDAAAPRQVVSLLSGVSAIYGRALQTCAIHNGAAKCWGVNNVGQIGDGTTANALIPAQVAGLTSGVSAISTAYNYSCAVHNGAAKCWGWDVYGQLGNGAAGDSTTPAQVNGLTSGVTAISAGYQHACAIQNGAAKCWGKNESGQLGDGTSNNASGPVQVAGLTSGVTAITAGAEHSCALHNGAVKCWGAGSRGQLGHGAGTDSSAPVQAMGLSAGVTALSGGTYHSCVIHSGAAKCWGSNAFGKLGVDDTGTDFALAPTQVTGLTSGVTAVSAGISHSCAVHQGALKCWGRGEDGELGDGGTTSHFMPSVVTFP
jgi:hypothetical protein